MSLRDPDRPVDRKARSEVGANAANPLRGRNGLRKKTKFSRSDGAGTAVAAAAGNFPQFLLRSVCRACL